MRIIVALIIMLNTSCTVLVTSNKARVRGELIYPGEFYPNDLRAFALNTATGDSIELTLKPARLNRDGKLIFREKLPAGTWSFYALSESTYGKYRAFYTEFIDCGMSVNCESHDIIELDLEAGKRYNGIDIGDWYKPG